MWIYNQKSGKLLLDGKLISIGYSGKGRGKNNPALQNEKGIGPIPRGDWIIGKPYNSASVGPYSIPLYAVDANIDDTHSATGRSAFRIHGDSIKNAGGASRGCIIMPRLVREKIIKSGIKRLRVE